MIDSFMIYYELFPYDFCYELDQHSYIANFYKNYWFMIDVCVFVQDYRG